MEDFDKYEINMEGSTESNDAQDNIKYNGSVQNEPRTNYVTNTFDLYDQSSDFTDKKIQKLDTRRYNQMDILWARIKLMNLF